jgi:hypothetical protein
MVGPNNRNCDSYLGCKKSSWADDVRLGHEQAVRPPFWKKGMVPRFAATFQRSMTAPGGNKSSLGAMFLHPGPGRFLGPNLLSINSFAPSRIPHFSLGPPNVPFSIVAIAKPQYEPINTPPTTAAQNTPSCTRNFGNNTPYYPCFIPWWY